MVALVFVGLTGSGKSSLARCVARDLELKLVSSGEIARQMAQSDAYAKAGLERGDWAPELAMRAEVLAQIEAASAQTGAFVIEGFPRRLEQLYILESVPSIRPLYFILDCDPLICLRRLVARARKDDHPDAVATRFRAFQELTRPMIALLRPHAHRLDGSLSLEILAEQVAVVYQQDVHIHE